MDCRSAGLLWGAAMTGTLSGVTIFVRMFLIGANSFIGVSGFIEMIGFIGGQGCAGRYYFFLRDPRSSFVLRIPCSPPQGTMNRRAMTDHAEHLAQPGNDAGIRR
jgi:hypothetical protein